MMMMNKQFGRKLELTPIFDLKYTSKIKVISYHPTKPLFAYINGGTTINIWDYERTTCLRCFSTSNLESRDLSKTLTIKDIMFFDKDLLAAKFPNSSVDVLADEKTFYKDSWLICIGESKVYFYDYVCEKMQRIEANDLEGRPPCCLEIVDPTTLAVGTSDGLIKIFDILNWNFTKSLRGFHTKLITQMIVIEPPINVNKNLILASCSDGTLACWNVDNEMSPLFKFLMVKGGRTIAQANGGEDVLSMSFNRQTQQIITVSTHYITLWSSKGDEIVRYKNFKDNHKNSIIGAYFLYHGDVNKDYVIAHAKSSELLLFDIQQAFKSKEVNIETLTLLDFKNLRDYDKNIKIYMFKPHYAKPQYMFCATSQGAFILQVQNASQAVQNIVSNPFWTTYIQGQQVRDFIQDFKVRKLSSQEIQKLQNYEVSEFGSRLPNILLLSASNQNIYCHLIERQKLGTVHGSVDLGIKTIIHQHTNIPAFEDEPEVQTSMSGRYFSVFYRNVGMVYIFGITNLNISQQNPKDNLINIDYLHPCSSITKIFAGGAQGFVWHNERDEFAMLAPTDAEGKILIPKERIESVSKGFFGSKSIKKTLMIDPTSIKKIAFLVFCLHKDGNRIECEIVHRNEVFNNPNKLFGGPYYGITDRVSEDDFKKMLTPELEGQKRDIRSHKTMKLSFYCYNQKMSRFMQIGNPIPEPQQIYWNSKATVFVAVYDYSFFVYKVNDQQEFVKLGSINKSILSGYFLEGLFFYITETEISMACFDLHDGILDMPLARDEQDPLFMIDTNLDEYFTKRGVYIDDSIYPIAQIKPHGHLKIIGVYDYKLAIINSRDEIFTIELYHSFTRILMAIQFDRIKECIQETERLDCITYSYIYDIFLSYGYQNEAEELISDIKDQNIVSKCALIKTFYENSKHLLYDPSKIGIIYSDIADHVALEMATLKDSADFSEVAQKFKKDKLTAIDLLHPDLRTKEFKKNYPGVQLATEKVSKIKKLDMTHIIKNLQEI